MAALFLSAWREVVSRASRIFLYFRWEEREGEKNTSGHSDQLPMPRRNVIIAAGHAHSMQIKTFIQLCYCFVKLVPTLANCCDRELIRNDAASSRKWTQSVISPIARAATDAASSGLRIQEQVILMLFLHSQSPRPAPVVYKAQSKVRFVECRRKRVVYELACRKSCA